MARVLVTRAAADGVATARRLAALGHAAVLAPVIAIRPTGAAIPAGPFDAVMATSRQALAFPDGRPAAGLAASPFFAVGERTAETAREAGFADVRAAEGDRRDLAALVLGAVKPVGRLLVLAGRDRHAELEALLREAGHSVKVVVTYAAEAAEALPDAGRRALGQGDIDAVLHYSPRSARLFAELARRAVAAADLARPRHLCLSAEVAAALPPALAGRASVANKPDEAALLSLLEGADRHEEGEIPAQPAPLGKESGAKRSRRVETTMPDHRDETGAPREAARRTGPTLDLKAQRVDEQPDPVPTAEEPATAAPAGPPPEAAAGPPPASPPPASAATSGVAAYLATGLAGAIIAAVALIVPRLQPADERPDALARRLEARLAAVEQKVAPAALEPLARRIDELAAAGQRSGVAAADLATRLASMEEAARKAAAAPPAPAAEPAVLAGLGDRLSRLEAALASRDPGAARDLAESLAARLVKAESALAAIRPGVDTKDFADLAGRVEAGLRQIEPQLKEGLASTERRLAGLAERLATAEAALKGHGDSLAAAEVVRRRALAEALVGAFHRGESYKDVLDGLARLGVAGQQTEALAVFAANGAPGGPALARRFAPLAGRLAATGAAPRDGSVADRLASSFANLVRVRPVDATGGDPAAVVARIEAALARGAFADAAAAWAGLPAEARAAGKEFGDLLAARVAAEKAAAGLHAETLKNLSAPKG